MKPLNGLRGLASLHVVLTHIFHGIQVDLMSSAILGLFYMLSGFLLTVSFCQKPLRISRSEDFPSYSGDAIYARFVSMVPGLRNGTGQEHQKGDTSVIGGWSFFKRRLQRLLPVYYVGNIIGALANHLGASHFMMNGTSLRHLILTVLGATSWFPPMLPMGSLVTWSVSTMIPFYFIYPAIAPLIQNVDRSKLFNLAVKMYLIQGSWMLFCIIMFLVPPRDFWRWYFWSRNPPPMRLPVFIMGCCAGMEHLHRLNDEKTNCEKASRQSANWEFIKCFTPILMGVIIGMSGDDNECYELDIGFCFDNGLVRMLLEALMPILYYDLILALVNPVGDCGNPSWFLNLCNSKFLQFVGEISYSLLVVHFTVYVTMKFVTEFRAQIIPPTIFLSIFGGWLMYRFYEKPMVSYLHRSGQKGKKA